MMHKIIILVFLVSPLFTVSAEEERISRKNLREVKRESFYYRVEKNFNYSFCKRHFESDPGKYELITYLIETSDLFDVSPRAVFGTIMAEHSMNQRSQLKQKGEAGINFLGKKFGEKGESLANSMNVYFRSATGEATFGPGQIQPAVAKAMQSRIRKTRPEASEEELDKYTWKGAINIMAAYMDYAAEQYEKADFQEVDALRENPAVLATLLNIGEKRKSFSKRAEESQKFIESGERDGPWINYFGYWIYRNDRLISSKLKKAEEAGAKLLLANSAE